MTALDGFTGPPVLTLGAACAAGCPLLYQRIGEGRLEVRKIGKRTLIPAASLRALIGGQA